jgi:phosphohistidine phosphatase
MDLYLMRHGIAHELGEQGITRDSERTLTAEGRQKTRAVAHGLRKLEVCPDLIASSTLTRALETARLVAEVLECAQPVEARDILEPGARPEEVLGWLKGVRADSVLVVGHMPDLGELASFLLGGSPNLAIQFKKAAVCCLAFDHAPSAGKARLEWLMPPRALQALGKE